jgi:hypothetical protein
LPILIDRSFLQNVVPLIANDANFPHRILGHRSGVFYLIAYFRFVSILR